MYRVKWLAVFTRSVPVGETTMIKLRTAALVSFILGVLSLLAMLTSYLALTDIRRREMGLSFEWQVLQISSAVIICFQVSALFTLRRVLRSVKKLATNDRIVSWSPKTTATPIDLHGVHRSKKPAAVRAGRELEPRVHCEKASVGVKKPA
jgi:hypothetical protein